jgi:hypothetical protein
MVGVPVAYATGPWLKATGTVLVRFSNTPISSHGTRGRSRIEVHMISIHFSEQFPWEHRGTLPDAPGIYRISKAGRAIYFGKTWGEGGLRERIRAFNRSATSGMKGHAGGLTYHGQFGGDVSGLSVEVHVPLVVKRDPEVLYPYIQYIERRLIWEYVERHGGLPVCNSE